MNLIELNLEGYTKSDEVYKLNEEVTEFIETVESNFTKERRLEEASDVIQTVISCLQKCNISANDLEEYYNTTHAEKIKDRPRKNKVIWIQINNGIHEISNTGKIRNYKTKRMLRSFKNGKQPVPKVSLYLPKLPGKKVINTNGRLDVLVLSTFRPDLEPLPFIRHLDGNPDNCALDNLEYSIVRNEWEVSDRKPVMCIETGKIYPTTSLACMVLKTYYPELKEIIEKNLEYKGKHYKFL